MYVQAQKIHDDPARSQAVANAILNRVAQRTTPQMRVQAVPLAKALAMKLQQQQMQHAESAATAPASSH
jgi:orotate phosphoribosyltransferase